MKSIKILCGNRRVMNIFLESKELIRTVLTNNHDLFHKILADTKNIFSLYVKRSVHVPLTALEYAIQCNDIDMVKSILAYEKQSPGQAICPPPVVGSIEFKLPSMMDMLKKTNKSGDNQKPHKVLLQDMKDGCYIAGKLDTDLLEDVITDNESISKECIQLLSLNIGDFKMVSVNWIGTACRKGNKDVAAFLMEYADNQRFNNLHRECLTFTNQDLSAFTQASVRKASFGNFNITPLHIAAINPNLKYLEQIMNGYEYDVKDEEHRSIVHYAAACSSPKPLQFILQKVYLDYKCPDKKGITPLMIAAQTGRESNVKLLLEKEKENSS